MELNPHLIRRLRTALVLEKRSLPALVSLLCGPAGGSAMNAFMVVNYFMEAFDLGLMEAREITGAPCLGGNACTDEEADARLRDSIDMRHVAKLLQVSFRATALPPLG